MLSGLQSVQPRTSDPELLLQEHRAATAPHLALSHDADAVAQKVGLVHEMGRENNDAALALLLDQVPRAATRVRVHSARRLCKRQRK